MKKFLVMLLCIASLVLLAACDSNGRNKRKDKDDDEDDDKYAEYAGTYELYYMSGSFSLSNYEYYRIILKADGKCVIESKAPGNSQEYKATATYEIEEDVIKIYSKVNGATITETYDYVDGEIHMLNQNVGGYTINAKFRRNQD